jgi:hypothetical protein
MMPLSLDAVDLVWAHSAAIPHRRIKTSVNQPGYSVAGFRDEPMAGSPGISSDF